MKIIYTDSVTKKVSKKIGEEIITVKKMGEYSRVPKTGYKNYFFLVNGTFYVTVEANVKTPLGYSDKVTVEMYSDVKKREEEFGQKMNYRAESAGVPWNIAKLTASIEDDAEAVLELIKLKTLATSIDSSTTDLLKNVYSRNKCISELLSGYRLTCKSQAARDNVASFLLA